MKLRGGCRDILQGDGEVESEGGWRRRWSDWAERETDWHLRGLRPGGGRDCILIFIFIEKLLTKPHLLSHVGASSAVLHSAWSAEQPSQMWLQPATASLEILGALRLSTLYSRLYGAWPDFNFILLPI